MEDTFKPTRDTEEKRNITYDKIYKFIVDESLPNPSKGGALRI